MVTIRVVIKQGRVEPQTNSSKGNGAGILVGYERRDNDSKESDPS